MVNTPIVRHVGTQTRSIRLASHPPARTSGRTRRATSCTACAHRPGHIRWCRLSSHRPESRHCQTPAGSHTLISSPRAAGAQPRPPPEKKSVVLQEPIVGPQSPRERSHHGPDYLTLRPQAPGSLKLPPQGLGRYGTYAPGAQSMAAPAGPHKALSQVTERRLGTSAALAHRESRALERGVVARQQPRAKMRHEPRGVVFFFWLGFWGLWGLFFFFFFLVGPFGLFFGFFFGVLFLLFFSGLSFSGREECPQAFTDQPGAPTATQPKQDIRRRHPRLEAAWCAVTAWRTDRLGQCITLPPPPFLRTARHPCFRRLLPAPPRANHRKNPWRSNARARRERPRNLPSPQLSPIMQPKTVQTKIIVAHDVSELEVPASICLGARSMPKSPRKSVRRHLSPPEPICNAIVHRGPTILRFKRRPTALSGCERPRTGDFEHRSDDAQFPIRREYLRCPPDARPPLPRPRRCARWLRCGRSGDAAPARASRRARSHGVRLTWQYLAATTISTRPLDGRRWRAYVSTT